MSFSRTRIHIYLKAFSIFLDSYLCLNNSTYTVAIDHLDALKLLPSRVSWFGCWSLIFQWSDHMSEQQIWLFIPHQPQVVLSSLLNTACCCQCSPCTLPCIQWSRRLWLPLRTYPLGLKYRQRYC